jgi:hypothetical protein
MSQNMTQNESVAQPQPFALGNRSERKLTNPSSSQLDEVRHTMSMIHQQYEPSPPEQNMYEYNDHAPHLRNNIEIHSQNHTEKNGCVPENVGSYPPARVSLSQRESSNRKHRRSAD